MTTKYHNSKNKQQTTSKQEPMNIYTPKNTKLPQSKYKEIKNKQMQTQNKNKNKNKKK